MTTFTLKAEYKFIEFKETNLKQAARPVLHCLNRKSGDCLGMVFWYPAWRQWCFTQAAETIVFSRDCLLDVTDFLRQLNASKYGEKP